MGWLEFNIHIREALSLESVIYGNGSVKLFAFDLLDKAVPLLLDFVEPLVDSQKGRFNHWHYLIEPDKCRKMGKDYIYYEIRLRFEAEGVNLDMIKHDLLDSLREYADTKRIAMREDEDLGSHEGCHGERGKNYYGSEDERFGGDWDTIVEIMQTGSESALKILRLGRGLKEESSLQLEPRYTVHPYYLHLPANQLFVE